MQRNYWILALLAVSLFFAGCEDLARLNPKAENEAIRCQIESKGMQANGYGYEARCEAKGEPINIVAARVSISARVKDGGKTVTRSFGEVRPLSATVTVAPGRPLVLTGTIPKDRIGTMFNQGKVVFQANLHYGDKDVRKNMDYDALKSEEANFRAKYEILATANL